MKLTYDDQAGVAYVYVKDEIDTGEVDRTCSATVNLDLDKDGNLLGVEILEIPRSLRLALKRKADGC